MTLKDDLSSRLQELSESEKEGYCQVLKMCNEQIKFENNNGKTSTVFKIPILITGYPLINIKKCVKYLARYLQKEDIKFFFHKNDISTFYINWKHMHKPDKIKEEPSVIKNKGFDKNDFDLFDKIYKKF